MVGCRGGGLVRVRKAVAGRYNRVIGIEDAKGWAAVLVVS